MKLRIIICSYLLMISLLPHAQGQKMTFKHLTIEDGLSQSSITSILKDSRGFMWFGTEDGLNKYDGNTFTVYRHEPEDQESLSSSYINTIIEDKDGFLWIGTKNGLNFFNPDTEKFSRYIHSENNKESLSDNYINTLLKYNDNYLFIGTANGLSILNSQGKFSNHFSDSVKDDYSILSITKDEGGFLWLLSTESLEKFSFEEGIFSKEQDLIPMKKGLKSQALPDGEILWIGTDEGLLKFNTDTEEFKSFSFYDETIASGKNNVLSIIEQDELLWLGTSRGGLIRFNKKSETHKIINKDPYDRFSLNSTSARSLFIDEKNILWVGTYGGGINKYDPDRFNFTHYKHQPGDPGSLSENTIRALLLDSDDELWIGTHNGLNRMDRENNKLKVYKYVQSDTTTISSNTIRAVCEDINGTIWTGSWENGLNSYNKNTDTFKRYISLPGSNDSLGQIRSLIADLYGNIWIGGNGLWKFNPKTGDHHYFRDLKNQENNLSGTAVNKLFFGKNGLLWIATQKGLHSLDTLSNQIKKYTRDPLKKESLSHNYVTSIAQDKDGILWVGTYGGGLNFINPAKENFEHYNTSNGLLNDVIYGILIDKEGYIWFTSNMGLGRFDPSTESFRYFNVDQGIQSEEFNAGAYYKSQEGEMFFGGINGFNVFSPDSINQKKDVGDIVLTDFKILDKQKTFITQDLFDKHISRLKKIELEHNQNTFSFQFSELNYADNAENVYEYQLEGLDKSWISLGKERNIMLSNLSPGHYTLFIRANGNAEKSTSLAIRIKPPFWKTAWALIAYFVIAIIATFLIYKNTMRIRQTKKQFEQRIRNLEDDLSKPTTIDNLSDSNIVFPLKKINITSKNQKFLERAIEVVENHMEDSEFDVEKFVSEMYISRAQLHRKLKALTGHSTTKFIRLIRLKRAAKLLKGKTATVSEIAYKVGFDNIGYFSKCFKETFGKSPSQYGL